MLLTIFWHARSARELTALRSAALGAVESEGGGGEAGGGRHRSVPPGPPAARRDPGLRLGPLERGRLLVAGAPTVVAGDVIRATTTGA